MSDLRLTDKEERFAQLVVELGSQSEAYRRSYDVGDNTKAETIHVNSSNLASKTKVALRIEEIRENIQIKAEWKKLDSIQALKRVAQQAEKDGDIVNAVKAINSMFGWDKQTIDHTSSDGSMSPERKTLDDFYGDN